jgi:hypothetical protein
VKVVVIYRPKSEHARAVEDYLREFFRRTGHKIEAVDIDSKEGVQMAGLYDIMQHPAILAMSEDGKLVQCWIGESLPLIDDVMGYMS